LTVEAKNLHVSVCVSGSHPALDSIRMGPVCMILAQNAETIAAFAIEKGGNIYNVPNCEINSQLLSDRRIIDLEDNQ